MKLVFNSTTIVDLNNKEAKKVEFVTGKNFLTSKNNHVGKSIIIKSLYYSLGADVFFSAPIKNINFLTILDFTIDRTKYKVARLKKEFVLLQEGNSSITYHSIGEFGEKLREIFGFAINLVGKDEDKSIVSSPPVFFYLPYYIDQEYGWAPNSYSFNNMTQFDLDQRKLSFFYHLGSYDDNYAQLVRQQKSDEQRIKVLGQEINRLVIVIKTLQSGFDSTLYSFDAEALEKAICTRQAELETILNEIELVRDKLVRLDDERTNLLFEKEIVSKYIKQKSKDIFFNETTNIDCPRCGLVFSTGIIAKLQRAYLVESLNEDFTRILEYEARIDKKRDRLTNDFKIAQSNLKKHECSLDSDKSNYDFYLRTKATKALIEDFNKQMLENERERNELSLRRTSIKQGLEQYAEKKEVAQKKYCENFSRILDGLDVPSNQVEGVSEPGSFLEASGAYGPRCKVSQLLAFVKTKHGLCEETINFPIVIDSPNSLEQDDFHIEAILRTLFTWAETDSQIIVASIMGRDIAESIPNVNIIELDNEPNHVMSRIVYDAYIDEINSVLLSF